MTKNLSAVVNKEGDWFVAQCLEVDVASQGKSPSEAMQNLRDALMLHYSPPLATVLPEIQKFTLDLAA